MRKRGLCCRSVSVCSSVTLVDCIHTAEDVVRLLARPGSPITLSFFEPSASTQFQGEPLQRRRKIHWGGKNCLSLKQYVIGPWLLWNVNGKS